MRSPLAPYAEFGAYLSRKARFPDPPVAPERNDTSLFAKLSEAIS
jgi:hypothetical protein